MTAMSSGITILNQFHNFKSWSQVAEEAKGEYLEGFIQIAPGVRKVPLALYAKDGKSGHPCLLFVTPCTKTRGLKVKLINGEALQKVSFKNVDWF